MNKTTFKSFLTETKDYLTDVPKGAQEILQSKVPMILHQANQAHIFHLLTKNYKFHNALGDFYTTLREAADDIGETWIALGGEITIPEFPELSLDASKENILNYLEGCMEYNLKCLELTKDIDLLTSINDSFTEIQGAINKVLYFVN